MSTPAPYPPAPTDADADAAWEEIMELARAHCLVVDAYGGSAILATPAAQRRFGQRSRVLEMHCRAETERSA